jgi:predicted acyltransferase
VSTVANDRLVSLDAFRGFTIASMVLVNNPGDWSNAYSQLLHAKWHGWTFTDWIFPFFLFIVGVSMVFSLAKKPLAVEDRSAAMRSLWKRAVIIFVIGLALNFIPSFDFDTLRIPGVLQRIALCILLAAPIVIFLPWRAWVVAILAFFVAYLIPMFFVAVPGADGVVSAARFEAGNDFGAFVDRALLSGHLWASAKTWDPEGVFSTLPAVSTLLFGALTGRYLLSKQSRAEKSVWMLLAGLMLVWLGSMLDVVLMPINKPLWTVSYSVFTAGWALVVFGAFYWLIDGCAEGRVSTQARRIFLPLTIFGMNALFIFALSGLIAKILNAVKVIDVHGGSISLKVALYAPLKALPISSVNASLLFAIVFGLAMFLVAWFMWRKKWFVKV